MGSRSNGENDQERWLVRSSVGPIVGSGMLDMQVF